MNIFESFVEYLEDNSVATLGQDLFISRAPKTPNRLYWLTSSGGQPAVKNVNQGFQLTYLLSLYFRDNDGKIVYDTLHDLQQMLLSDGCIELQDFVVTSINTNGPFTDADLDNENRAVGLLEISIETYRS